MIPMAQPTVGEEEAAAAAQVIRSGLLASGEEVSRFEQEFAGYIRTGHAIATSNGTTALHAALLALGIRPGDEVIVPSFTFIATATSVSMCGAVPVVADIEKTTYCIDPESVTEQVTPRTRALIGVHLFGQPCDIGALREICTDHRLFLIEDCAQAHGASYHGAKVGSFGDAGCFSFYPTKNMTSGEGGMITCNDTETVRKIRILINHGQSEKYLHTTLGYNYRMTNISAAIGRVQLGKLESMNRKRQENAAFYSKTLPGDRIILPQTRNECTHVYHQYAIRIPPGQEWTRDTVARHLGDRGIMTAIHYPVPVHDQPVYKDRIPGSSCPVARRVSGEILSLPVYPGLTEEERKQVTDALMEMM
jgi:perosamine synthetase